MKTRAPVTDKDFGPNAKRPYEDDANQPAEAEGGKKGKEPKEKKDKASKGDKTPSSAGPKIKTRTHPFIVMVLTMLFALIVAAAGLFLLYLDVGGWKAPFVEFFLDTPLAVDIQEQIYLDRELVIEEREQAAAILQEFNEQWQIDLEVREWQFARDLADFERRQRLAEEDDARRAEEIAYLEDLQTGQVAFEEAAAPFARMDAEEAAAILSAMDNSILALRIFGSLNVARRAAILVAFTEDQAARFTEDSVWQAMQNW